MGENYNNREEILKLLDSKIITVADAIRMLKNLDVEEVSPPEIELPVVEPQVVEQPVVEETIEELQGELTKQSMTTHVDIPAESTIYGNYSLLHSIFRNLLENSIRYAGQGTKVEISCYKKNSDTLFFRYYNNGVQIPEEHLPRLFERFYRITEGRTRDCGGTGLGLSIVKNAVNFHSGDIIVKNLLDQGVEFLFTLKRGK